MVGENGLPNGHDPAPAPEPAPVRSLREIAEETYTSLESGEGAQDDAPIGGDQPVDDRGDGRDNRGRFVAKPGEQSAPADPALSRDENAPPAQSQPDPAGQPPSSNQAPANWSENDRQMFATLPQEGQAFLLRRHTEMEGDYTRRAQSAASAIGFAEALAPVFTDQVIRANLHENGLSPSQAISEWAAMHKRAIDPDPNVRMGLLRDIAQRVGIDPATIGTSRSDPAIPGLSAQDLADPAIKFFADRAAKQDQELSALRGTLANIQKAEESRVYEVAVKTARSAIDEFADAKDGQGNLIHPFFDEAMPALQELMRVNPQRSLKEAYETACWSTPSIREKLIASQSTARDRQAAAEKARLAQRGNTRGITSPVSRPPAPDNGKPRSLREVAEAAADEIGF